MIRDPAGWLSVNPENGIIKVRSKMDRESPFVKDNKYTALIGAFDDGKSRRRPGTLRTSTYQD